MLLAQMAMDKTAALGRNPSGHWTSVEQGHSAGVSARPAPHASLHRCPRLVPTLEPSHSARGVELKAGPRRGPSHSARGAELG